MQFLKEEKYWVKLSHLILIETIRGDFCVEIGGNICHGWESAEYANNYTKLLFEEEELNNYN